ncbi:proton-conducting transporter membrane subunit [Alkalilimnicola ehrlichii]|uniref:NADH:quinone oxidoreductase/Mrp antiporter transmembrane domain-containing protein n=2 Tax=Alkalilimnicola ehrlichii TaxID=351052 RepID=A0A3E0X2W7_9GAMM|nr:proton-conducting transporter membrane subunit [Alkalilimnicola ehrlichii]RFA38981.1 hypothetical protein CAL65_03535 [Alkalilimnicola ehrlichii]
MSVVLLTVVLVPLVLAIAVCSGRTCQWAARLLPYASWPALLTAVFGAEGSVVYSPILFGLLLGLDELGRIFLGFTALVWTAAGFHLRSAGLPVSSFVERRFVFCYLLAMVGNLGVMLAFGGPGFYLFFALLSLAGYGLIVTDREPQTRRAGRIYVILALFSELMILAGFIFLAAGRSGPFPAVLLFFGLGIKHGVLPLHMWLPLAHGIAPPPASALLSGVLLKAGAIGWLRFLPETAPVLAEWSVAIIALGMAAAVLAALVGAVQTNPKMMLAYSSISQMGIFTAGFGMAVASPSLWPLLVPALALFACQHALVKAALFLGVGTDRAARSGGWVWPVLGLLSLALVGAPMTAAAMVKLWFDGYLSTLPAVAGELLAVALPLTTVTSTLLMSRFVWALRKPRSSAEGVGRGLASPVPFLGLTGLALLIPWLLAWSLNPEVFLLAFAGASLWKTLWPMLVGAATALLLARWAVRWRIPPGDIVVPLEWLAHHLKPPVLPVSEHRPRHRYWFPPMPWPQMEAYLRRSPVTG